MSDQIARPYDQTIRDRISAMHMRHAKTIISDCTLRAAELEIEVKQKDEVIDRLTAANQELLARLRHYEQTTMRLSLPAPGRGVA